MADGGRTSPPMLVPVRTSDVDIAFTRPGWSGGWECNMSSVRGENRRAGWVFVGSSSADALSEESTNGAMASGPGHQAEGFRAPSGGRDDAPIRIRTPLRAAASGSRGSSPRWLRGVSVAFASIPDPGGVVHGCYQTKGKAHTLKVIDSAVKANCPTGLPVAQLQNQAGPQGPLGRRPLPSAALGRQRRSVGHLRWPTHAVGLQIRKGPPAYGPAWSSWRLYSRTVYCRLRVWAALVW